MRRLKGTTSQQSSRMWKNGPRIKVILVRRPLKGIKGRCCSPRAWKVHLLGFILLSLISRCKQMSPPSFSLSHQQLYTHRSTTICSVEISSSLQPQSYNWLIHSAKYFSDTFVRQSTSELLLIQWHPWVSTLLICSIDFPEHFSSCHSREYLLHEISPYTHNIIERNLITENIKTTYD